MNVNAFYTSLFRLRHCRDGRIRDLVTWGDLVAWVPVPWHALSGFACDVRDRPVFILSAYLIG